MYYDLSQPFQVKNFQLRVKRLIEGGKGVTLKEEIDRTLSQNSYLHLLLSYFASQIGERMEYVKSEYYKLAANADIYKVVKYDTLLGDNVVTVRSSKDLTKEEMSLSIERFKTWSAQVAGIPLPDAESPEEIREARAEAARAQAWI